MLADPSLFNTSNVSSMVIKNSQEPPIYPNGPGTGITREWWTGIIGTTVANLTGNAAYPVSPTGTRILTGFFETPTDFDDNYGQRLHGYFIPPATGAYTSRIASADSSELWLSNGANPVGAVLIASTGGTAGSREWTKYASQKSAAITLTAGNSYYIRALHKEGTGSDNLAVGVDMPNGSFERPIAGNRLNPAQVFSLASSAANGDITLSPPGGTYNIGTVVTVTANPGSGYGFTGWSGDLSGIVNPTTITMDGNKSITSNTAAAGSFLSRTGWVASASSSNGGPSNAIDGESNTRWSTGSNQTN